MDNKDIEKHWEFVEMLLTLAGHSPTPLERFLYIEAMKHGAKHQAAVSSPLKLDRLT